MCNFRERKQEVIKSRENSSVEAKVNNNPCPSSSDSESEGSDHVMFTVYGNFNLDIAPGVLEEIAPLFAGTRKGVMMNLEAVTAIDSAGIATIVECVRMASDSETEFHVIGVNRKVKEVLELVKLSSLFENIELRTAPCSSREAGALGCYIRNKYSPYSASFSTDEIYTN